MYEDSVWCGSASLWSQLKINHQGYTNHRAWRHPSRTLFTKVSGNQMWAMGQSWLIFDLAKTPRKITERATSFLLAA